MSDSSDNDDSKNVASVSGDHKQESMDQLRSAAQDAVKNTYGWCKLFLAANAAVLLPAILTTDEILLRGGVVLVPNWNVEIPLDVFYGVVPSLYLLMHAFLLARLCALSRKLEAYADGTESLSASQRQVQLGLINMFPFTHRRLMGDEETRAGIITHLLLWAFLLVVPVALLCLVQCQFLAFHHEWIHWMHRFCVLGDAAVIWWYRPGLLALSSRRKDTAGRPQDGAAVRTVSVSRQDSAQSQERSLKGVPAPRRIGSRIWRHITATLRRVFYWRRLPPRLAIASAVCFSLFVATVPGGRMDRVVAFLCPPLHGLLEEPAVMYGLNRSLFVRQECSPRKVGGQDDGTEGAPTGGPLATGINLVGRDLRFADLTCLSLEGAKLHGCDLRNAILEGCNLQEATFLEKAKFKDAFDAFKGGEEYGGDWEVFQQSISAAKLQGACLNKAILRNADLRALDLSGVQLEEAELHRADLSHAFFDSAARLRKAKLHGARLILTELKGTDLTEAELFGANLLGTQFILANLKRAKLCGADLKGVYLHATQLCKARLHGTTLFNLELMGIDLREVHFHPKAIDQTTLVGVDLRKALIGGAGLGKSELTLCDLTDASFASLAEQECDCRTRHNASWDAAIKAEEDYAWCGLLGAGFNAYSTEPGPFDECDNLDEGKNRLPPTVLAEFACKPDNVWVLRGFVKRAIDTWKEYPHAAEELAEALWHRKLDPQPCPGFAEVPAGLLCELEKLAKQSKPAGTSD